MDNDKNYLDRLRHSTAHLLAAAILELYPNAKPSLGPPIENGFYYDFDFGKIKISEDDLGEIEEKMRQLVPSWSGFARHEVSEKEAVKEFTANPYKKELIEEFANQGQKLTIYQSGDFRDLCRGDHVDKPNKEIRHFKLLSIAGAYWRGSEKNKMLTRIYGTVWPTKKELEQYLWQIEETKRRDHRRLGQDLDLYSTNPLTGAGLILWHPKLSIVRTIVEHFWKEEHLKQDYQLVYTPHIASVDMFVIGRHLSKYIDYMFPIMLHQYIEGESAPDYHVDEVLKPMNCPNHIQIYKERPRSYKELPIRLAELGTVYRYERAGVLHGMTRVRGFTQDDTHIFCRPDQIVDEVKGVIQLTRFFYETFGFSDYKAYLATMPDKHLGSETMWDFAQNALKHALEEERVSYHIDEGQGAFYGPKIDSKVKDSLGREWQLGTIQVDFNQPAKAETTAEEIEEFWMLKTFQQKFKTKENLARYLKRLGRGFDVTFINKQGREEHVTMIHRTILGSMERFFGLLIEHYAGAFPLWLSPVQVAVLPVSDKHSAYGKKVSDALKEENVRVELDDSDETLSKKIRNWEVQKVPYIVVVGKKEEDNNKIAVRKRGEGDKGSMEIEKFISDLRKQISRKS